jgi:hypothetical protein
MTDDGVVAPAETSSGTASDFNFGAANAPCQSSQRHWSGFGRLSRRIPFPQQVGGYSLSASHEHAPKTRPKVAVAPDTRILRNASIISGLDDPGLVQGLPFHDEEREK